MTDNLLTKGIITMNFLEERIMKDGVVKEGNILKVDSFLNHQMDVKLFKQKTAYEITSRDWSSDVCSSDLSGQEL